MRLTNVSRTKSSLGVTRAVFHVSGASSQSGPIQSSDDEIDALKQLLQLWDRDGSVTIDVLNLIEKYKAQEVVRFAQENAQDDD